jgi:hypothetical protein
MIKREEMRKREEIEYYNRRRSIFHSNIICAICLIGLVVVAIVLILFKILGIE